MPLALRAREHFYCTSVAHRDSLLNTIKCPNWHRAVAAMVCRGCLAGCSCLPDAFKLIPCSLCCLGDTKGAEDAGGCKLGGFSLAQGFPTGGHWTNTSSSQDASIVQGQWSGQAVACCNMSAGRWCLRARSQLEGALTRLCWLLPRSGLGNPWRASQAVGSSWKLHVLNALLRWREEIFPVLLGVSTPPEGLWSFLWVTQVVKASSSLSSQNMSSKSGRTSHAWIRLSG